MVGSKLAAGALRAKEAQAGDTRVCVISKWVAKPTWMRSSKEQVTEKKSTEYFNIEPGVFQHEEFGKTRSSLQRR